jgi:hypothetical protein
MDLVGFFGELWKVLMSDAGVETLKIVFDGILGASVGALVAMVVLRRTLTEQRTSLVEQLDKQEVLHREQLWVQRNENARIRLHEVVAQLLANLVVLAEAMHARPSDADRSEKFTRVRLEIMVNLERLHLDLKEGEEADIYHVLYGILGIVYNCIELAHWEDEPPHPSDLDAMRDVIGTTGATLVEWVRGNEDERKSYVEQLVVMFKMIDAGDSDGWLQLSTSGDYDSSKIIKERFGIS